MGIKIKFSIGPKHKLIPLRRWDAESAEAVIRKLAEESGYSCDRIEGYFKCRLCPEGDIWFLWDNKKVIGESQTNIVGPGFHVAVIDFLERLAKAGGWKLEVDDQTGYYRRRDFLSMRRNYFYRWFTEVMAAVSGWEEGSKETFCWPDTDYEPEGREGALITHIRPFTYGEIRGLVNSGMSMAFAREFFIWNELEKDAWYYRNCGLALLNQTCFFMPSKRSAADQKVNAAVIENLEKAISMDRTIPYPVMEYLEVCALAEHEPVDVEGLSPMPRDVEAGCRKHLIYRKLGKVKFPLPGSFIFDEKPCNGMDHYYDGEGYGGHDYYIYGVAIEARGQAAFKEAWFTKGTPEETVEFEMGEAKAKVVFYEPEAAEGITLYHCSAQVLYQEQRTNIHITSRKPGEKEWTLELVKKIRITE